MALDSDVATDVDDVAFMQFHLIASFRQLCWTKRDDVHHLLHILGRCGHG